MRWIGRSLVAAASLCGVWLLVIPAVSELWQSFGSTSGKLEQARASTFFPLHKQRWLTFDVPANADIFRVYSHAALQTGISEQPLRYIIDYQWLDENGDLLHEQQHHISTRTSATQRPVGGSRGADIPIAARFYDHERSQPGRDQALYFSAEKLPGARALRLRVNSMDAGILEIGIRPYQRHQRSARNLDIAWQRMSAAQRDSLSKGSLFPSFLLSEYERKNLLSSYWKPVGPLGVLNRDYRIKTLYQRETTAPDLPPETPATDGLFAGPDQWVTLTLEEPEGLYRIEGQSLTQGEPPAELQLQWQGRDSKQHLEWRGDLSQRFWEGSMAAGLLQLVSDQPVMLKLLRWEATGWRDITPEKRYSRAFFCTRGEALKYTLAPGTLAQSLKIDARDYVREDQTESIAGARINLRLIDENGAATYDRTLELSTQNNPYQQFSDAASVPSQVFEPLSSYLDAEASAETLLISCNGPSLISVYSRPWRHPVSRELPFDNDRLSSYQQREPAWFVLLPENLDALVREKRFRKLVWYFKPQGLDSIVSDGDYQRQTLLAGNPEVAEWLVLSSHESDSRSRMEARGSAFYPLEQGTTLFFAGRSNEKLVRPSLVYQRENREPRPVQVWIDHTLVLETTIVGETGKLRLPYVEAGRHHVDVLSEDTRWYINNTAEAGQSHLLRTAFSMVPDDAGSSLTFSLNTSGSPQQLGFWLFAPGEAGVLNCRLRLRAKRAATLQHSHSMLDYNYQLSSGEYEKSFVLNRKETDVRGPIRLVMALGSDVPAQAATARLSCDQPGVLASAGIISRGLSTYRVFEEPNDA